MNARITFSRMSRETPSMHSIAVFVDDVQVGELMRDPTAPGSEWYSHESDVRLPDGRVAGLGDTDYGTTARQAKRYAAAYIRGMLAS